MIWRTLIIAFFILTLAFTLMKFIATRTEKSYLITVEYINGGTEDFRTISRTVPQLNGTGCLSAGGRTLVCGVKTIRNIK